MSSSLCAPSKKFSWLKKMDARIKKSLKNGENTQNEHQKTKKSVADVEIVHKSE